MTWYVIKTKVRQEQRAQTHLENQDFTIYCPRLVRKNGSVEALFPGYIFIKLDCFATRFTSVRSTRGVQAILKFGDWWATVDDRFIDFLRFKENGYSDISEFQSNQSVVFKDGPFKDIEAVYLCANGKDRAMVLLTLLGRKQTIVVKEELLKAV